MAYSEGYEAAQKEFGIVKKTNKAAKKAWEAAEGSKGDMLGRINAKKAFRGLDKADKSPEAISKRVTRDIKNNDMYSNFKNKRGVNASINDKAMVAEESAPAYGLFYPNSYGGRISKKSSKKMDLSSYDHPDINSHDWDKSYIKEAMKLARK